tara:strand:+ start:3029 stop:3205 length:177 start_codon:yes stop_codon:yes gene_type:complete
MNTKRIPATLTDEQVKMIDFLIGSIGTNQSDVVSKIVVMWLNEQDYLSQIVKKKFLRK